MSNMPSLAEFTIDHHDEDLHFQAVRQTTRRAVTAALILVFGFGSAAAFIPIGGAVMAHGQLTPESRVKHIASALPSQAIVTKTFVSNGQHVNVGDPLVQFDATVADLQAQLAGQSMAELLARRARLDAERLGASKIAFPLELASSPDPVAAKAMADEARLFQIRRDELAGMRAQLTARVTQNRRQAQGYAAQIDALRRQSALIMPERQGVADLWKRGLVTITRKNQLEREAIDLESNVAALQAQMAQTEAQNTEIREQMIQLAQSRRVEAANELSSLSGSLDDQRLKSASSTLQSDRSLLRAPYSGVVDKLAVTALGEVISPSQTVLEIVPDRDELVAEATVSPADIDRIHQGQAARVRLTSMQGSATPDLSGKVIFVAPERTVDAETKSTYFVVRIALDRGQTGLPLRSGMPAEVMISSGERSLLSWLSRPLRDQLSRAFRHD